MARDKANEKAAMGIARANEAPSQGTPTMPSTPLTHQAETAAAQGTDRRGFNKGGLVKSTGKLNTGIKPCHHN